MGRLLSPKTRVSCRRIWNGTGAYTGTDVNIMCVYLSKYEIEDLVRIVHTMDPTAFLTVQEGPRIYGNFTKKIG